MAKQSTSKSYKRKKPGHVTSSDQSRGSVFDKEGPSGETMFGLRCELQERKGKASRKTKQHVQRPRVWTPRVPPEWEGHSDKGKAGILIRESGSQVDHVKPCVAP